MSRALDAAIAGGIAVACATLYLVTLTPGLPHPAGDSHELTTAAAGLGLAHRTGYPLYTWLGFLFCTLLPVGEIAWRTNAMSALLGAAGTAGLYVLGRQLGLVPLIAAFGALLFALAPSFWSQAVITEVYAVNVCTVAVLLNLLVAWSHRRRAAWLVAFAFVFGLSPGTHMSNLSLAPAYALFILLADARVLRRPRLLLAMLAVFLVGLAQFAWLPFRADVARFPNPTPDTVAGFWSYTVGAFSGSRFAFPLAALPERLRIHVDWLAANFTLAGVLLALIGMWVCLARDPVRCWLLLASYLTSVVVFTQLAVLDIEVFFVAGYVPFALFAAFGLDGVRALLPASLRAPAGVAAIAVLLAIVGRTGFVANDRRDDTAVGDFLAAAFGALPPDSQLVGPSGVFGQSLEYAQRFAGLRPDVATITTPDGILTRPQAPRYTTLGVVDGALTPSSTWGLAPGVLPAGAWFVPAVAGARHDLMLWRVDPAPPAFAPEGATPAVRAERRVPGGVLEGHSVSQPAADRLRLETHWRLDAPETALVVGSRIGPQAIESHELGFGNRTRYAAEVGPPGTRIVEAYDVVVPSTLPSGRHPVYVGVVRFGDAGFATEWIEVGHADVA